MLRAIQIIIHYLLAVMLYLLVLLLLLLLLVLHLLLHFDGVLVNTCVVRPPLPQASIYIGNDIAPVDDHALIVLVGHYLIIVVDISILSQLLNYLGDVLRPNLPNLPIMLHLIGILSFGVHGVGGNAQT